METMKPLEPPTKTIKWDVDQDTESSNVKNLKFCRKEKLMQVTFHNGKAYQYQGVDGRLFNKVLKGTGFNGSIGKAFIQLVRYNGALVCTKVE